MSLPDRPLEHIGPGPGFAPARYDFRPMPPELTKQSQPIPPSRGGDTGSAVACHGAIHAQFVPPCDPHPSPTAWPT